MGVVKYGAQRIVYDNTLTGLPASNIKQAIDVLYGGKEPADATILKNVSIGVSVQAYNSNLTSVNQGLSTTSSPTFVTLNVDSLNVNNNFNVASDGTPSGTRFNSVVSTLITNGINTHVNNVQHGGGVIKQIFYGNTTSTSGTTTIVPGTGVPTTSNGTQLWTQNITPESTSSNILIQCAFTVAGSSNNALLTVAIFRNTTYIGSVLTRTAASNDVSALAVNLVDSPATTASITYSCRIGGSTGSWYVNRRPGENTYGGTKTGWTLSEI